MNQKTIPDNTVELVAHYINERSSKNYSIPVIGNPHNPETPQIFEIIPFDKIDKTDKSFYAIDGSYNSQQFYNGVSIGIYNAGYICYKGGKQIRMNDIYQTCKYRGLNFFQFLLSREKSVCAYFERHYG